MIFLINMFVYMCFFVCVFLSLRSSLTDSLFEMTSWATLSYYSVIFIIPFLSRDHRKTSSSFFDWCALLFKRIVIFRETLLLLAKWFKRSTHFCVTITGRFKHSQCVNFKTSFSKNKNLSWKTRESIFSWKY